MLISSIVDQQACNNGLSRVSEDTDHGAGEREANSYNGIDLKRRVGILGAENAKLTKG